MNKIHKNIQNLFSLWEIVSNCGGEYYQSEKISVAKIPNSEYPNRIWLNKYPTKLTTETIQKIKTIALQNKETLSFSLFTDDLHFAEEEQLLRNGFMKKSEQYGMSFTLKEKLPIERRLHFQLVQDKEQSQLWSDVFLKSFGYKISAESIYQSSAKIPFYILYFQKDILGTVLTYPTENIIGVHSLGILPEFRKLGFAEEVMTILINQSIDRQCETMTLQSSAMGRNLYLKLGFEEDFLMMNYVLN
ncbi:GNAT family N-acetyltransferase [Capnocytophaga canimorsus]|uniref:GNAT family N-acetyltransferase n=1 Tax=Capnocytophaga canimorsus TaxID=28188 RepID=UPI0037D38090